MGDILQLLDQITEEIGDSSYPQCENNLDFIIDEATSSSINVSYSSDTEITPSTSSTAVAIINNTQHSATDRYPKHSVEYLKNAYRTNEEYVKNLYDIKSQLLISLTEVKRDIRKICMLITKFKELYMTPRKPFECAVNCGAPYFKDCDFFPAPYSGEALKVKRMKMLRYIDLSCSDQWSRDEKAVLINSVLDNCRDIVIAGFRSQIAKLKPRRQKEELTPEEHSNNKETISEIQRRIDRIIHAPLDVVVNEYEEHFSVQRIDWDIISVKKVVMRTPGECRTMWEQILHPGLSKAKWTNKDNVRLVEIAENYNFQNWDAIAKEYGGRSAFQCFMHFQQKLNVVTLKEGKWTPEEDENLLAIIAKCRIGNHIPWAEVSTYFDNRSKNQLFQRYTERLRSNIIKGTFTEEEDCKLLAAIRHYKDFDKIPIQEILPNRTKTQARCRYLDVLQYIGKPQRSWTLEDDQKLLKLTESTNKQWNVVAEHFECRTRQMVRQRYLCLQKFLKNNDISKLKFAPRKVPKRKPTITTDLLESAVKDLEMNKQITIPKGSLQRGRPVVQKENLAHVDIDDSISNVFKNINNYAYGPQKKPYLTKACLKNNYADFKYLISMFNVELKKPTDIKSFNFCDYDRDEREFINYIVAETNKTKEPWNSLPVRENQPQVPVIRKHRKFVDPFAYRDTDFQPTNFNTAGLKTYSRKNKSASKLNNNANTSKNTFKQYDKYLPVLPPNYSTILALKTMFDNKSSSNVVPNKVVLSAEDIRVRNKFEEVLFQLFKLPGVQSFTKPSDELLQQLSNASNEEPLKNLAIERLNNFLMQKTDGELLKVQQLEETDDDCSTEHEEEMYDDPSILQQNENEMDDESLIEEQQEEANLEPSIVEPQEVKTDDENSVPSADEFILPEITDVHTQSRKRIISNGSDINSKRLCMN